MSDGPHESRHLPARHARRLSILEAGPTLFDGRSERLLEELVGYNFVHVVERDEKKPRRVTVALTERGKAALERNKRGVDPYLVMTE